MSDKPRPGGYLDRAALAMAVRCNKSMLSDLRTIVDDAQHMSAMRRLQLVQRMTLHLGEQRDALAEMQHIRLSSVQED